MRQMPSRHTSTAVETEAPAIGVQVTGVRLPPSMRDQLMREAIGNHRSLSQEIIQRLATTLDDKRAPLTATHIRPVGQQQAAENGLMLTPAENTLLQHFAELSAEKQLALITFLKKP